MCGKSDYTEYACTTAKPTFQEMFCPKILQLVNSILRSIYIVLALDSVGYMWTFILFACIATAGKLKFTLCMIKL